MNVNGMTNEMTGGGNMAAGGGGGRGPDMSGLLQAAGMEEKSVDPSRAVSAAVREMIFSEDAAPAIIDQLGKVPIESAAPTIVAGLIGQIIQQFPNEVQEADLFGPGKALETAMGDVFDLAEQFGMETTDEQYTGAMRKAVELVHATYQKIKRNEGGNQPQQQPMGGMQPPMGGMPQPMGGGGGLLAQGGMQ